MYADRITSGTERSIRYRLDGDLAHDTNRSSLRKRQRGGDDKWKHDLFESAKAPQVAKTKLGSRDLRLKLLNKATNHGSNESGVRDLRRKLSGTTTTNYGSRESGAQDLREKLSGTMNPQPASANVNSLKTKAAPMKVVQDDAKLVRQSGHPRDATKTEMKKVSAPSSSKNPPNKSNLTVDELLESLGLEKYSIQFQAEEVDMMALLHMSDHDLKALGVPMGPRKKIISALQSLT